MEKNPISKFFFKTSEIKCESFPEVKSSTEEAAQTNQFEDVKEEPTTHETKEGVLDFGGHGTDDKLEVQSLLKEGAENVEPNGTTNSLQWTQSFLILSRCHH